MPNTSYPNPLSISTVDFGLIAESFLRCNDFGAALYYAELGAELYKNMKEYPEVYNPLEIEDNILDVYIKHCGSMEKRARTELKRNLEISLMQFGIGLNNDNLETNLMAEFSQHYLKYRELKVRYGSRIIFDNITKIS